MDRSYSRTKAETMALSFRGQYMTAPELQREGASVELGRIGPRLVDGKLVPGRGDVIFADGSRANLRWLGGGILLVL